MSGSKSRLSLPKSMREVQEEANVPSRWFSWLFSTCSSGGAMVSGVYTKLTTKDETASSPRMTKDQLFDTNRQLLIKFDTQRQTWIEGANQLQLKALEQGNRSKNPKISQAERQAARQAAKSYVMKYKAAVRKMEGLGARIMEIQKANEALEEMDANDEYLRAMQANSQVLKNELERTGMSPERAGETMDELAETISQAQTVNREMSRNVVDTPYEMEFDDDDAEDLLNQWMAQETTQDLQTAPSVPPSTIPSADPTPYQPAVVGGSGSSSSLRIPRHFEQTLATAK